MVTARAVSSIGTKSVASCSFCSLNRTSKNHTLVLKNGATLRVDGDIYVNSSNGGASGACVPDPSDKGKWLVCGDGFDIFGDGGSITARTISVTGGWETHDGNPVKADYRVKMGNGSPCPQAPDPVQQVAPWLPSNVCIHMPQIADPLNDGSVPANMIPVPPIVGKPVAGVNGCPASGVTIPSGTAGSPSILSIQGSVTTKICPGTYYGGIKISGSANVTMLPGVYYIAGGGFLVSGAGSVDGTAGVMIYNSSGTADVVDTQEGVDLVPKSTPGHINLKNAKLKATPDKNIEIDEVVTLTLDPDGGAAPAPTGLVTFFDGNDPIPGCVNLPTTPTSATKSRATCTTSWATFGTKSISGVYYGDAVYNADGDAKTLTIPPPAGATIAPVTIGGSGNVKLYGESSGVYKGLTIFQNRSSTLTITLEPGAGAPACTGSWLTADVPDVDGVDPPAACGPLGGLRGTIYAAHSDALVFITASGLSNLQVISGKIQVDSDADARFAYTPEYFANGSIRLVE
jgi:hypothetical protein